MAAGKAITGSDRQDKYMAHGRVHTAVADMLDRTINDE